MKMFWLILFFSLNIFAQTSNEFLIIPKIKAGVTFPGLTSYHFTDNPSREENTSNPFPVYPGFYFGIGLESPDIVSFYETSLNLAIEISYGESSTGNVETFYGESNYTVTSLPILFWTKVKTKGRVVPFVRVGAGAERTEFIEKYNSRKQSEFNLREWFFSWGIGAGIDVNTFNNLTISFFVDSIIKEGGIIKEFNDGRELNYDFRNGMIFCGIQLGYKI